MDETADEVAVEAEILNKYGFHARPSTSFSQLAKEYASDIQVEVDGVRADGKSVMHLMTLGAACGATVRIIAAGPDAEEAANALKAHVDDRFGGIE